MNQVRHIFEHFLRDNHFMSQIDKYIANNMEPKHIPGLVLLIAHIIQEGGDSYGNVKNQNDLSQLFGYFYNYINNKLFYQPEFQNMFDTCIQLAVTNFKYSNRSWLVC
jgi:hypothetical protein